MTSGLAARDIGWWVTLGAFACALAAAGYLALAPMSSAVEESSDVTVSRTGSPEQVTAGDRMVVRRTLAATAGWPAVGAIALPPLLLTGVALLPQRRKTRLVTRGVAAGLMWLRVLLGALSFGVFYTPSACLLAISAILALTTKRDKAG